MKTEAGRGIMSNDETLRRIVVLSRRLRWTIRAIVVLSVLVVLLVLTGIGGWVEARLALGGTEVEMRDLPFTHRLLVIAAVAPFFAVCGWLLWSCDRLLRLYERGRIFGAENAALIRRAGQLVILLGVMESFLVPVGAAVVAGLASADGDTHLAIDPNLGLILVGVGIIVVGHVMRLGAEMAEESALTI